MADRSKWWWAIGRAVNHDVVLTSTALSFILLPLFRISLEVCICQCCQSQALLHLAVGACFCHHLNITFDQVGGGGGGGGGEGGPLPLIIVLALQSRIEVVHCAARQFLKAISQ